jgi:hypothetical protein
MFRRCPPVAGLAATLIAALALLVGSSHAYGNFVYWTSGDPNSSIARAKLNGTSLNTQFIGGLDHPHGVAIDSRFIYWTQGDATTGSIGRANLNGSDPNPSFIPHSAGVSDPSGIAVTPTAIYWQNGGGSIGRADLDGSAPNSSFLATSTSNCGVTADSSFLYFLNAGGTQIGRASLDGGSPQADFAAIPEAFCGLAVDVNYLYWASDGGNTVGRVPVGGGMAEGGFLDAGTSGGGPSGVAVNSQYIFWGNYDTGAIGRANVNGSAPKPALTPDAGVTGPLEPSQLTAAPSNKINVIAVANSKKKGTAMIVGGVPGPGQLTLDQTDTPGAGATAAAVQPATLDLPRAETFGLVVTPTGKTARRLNRQVSKKGKGRVWVSVFIHFVPAGVAGVPNTEPVSVLLIKKGRKTAKRKRKPGRSPSGPANRRILGE